MIHVESADRFIIAVLFAGLWQAPLFSLVAWSVLRLGPGSNATTRHSIFVAAFLASIVLPSITAGVSVTGLPETRGTADSQMREAPGDTPRALGTPVSREGVAIDAPSPQTIGIASPSRFNLSVPRPIVLGIATLWAGGAIVLLCRLFFAFLHLERMKRDASPLNAGHCKQLTRWAAATKGSRKVRLCTSSRIEIPIALGFLDPMILLPERLLGELEPHDVDSIVLHELAHLRRADDCINAIERVGLALLFFNPAIAWLARQIDLEREVACDDWVLQQNDALPYAACLVKVVESTLWPCRAIGALGALGSRRGISVRIERLLAGHRDVRVRTSLLRAGTAVTVLIAVGFVATLAAPSVAYSISLNPLDRADRPVALAAAQTDAPQAETLPDSGTWAIRDEQLPEIHFQIRIETPTDNDSWGRNERAPIPGLEPAELMGPGADVRFTIVRDAGRFECRGHVGAGSGSGTFHYVADATYSSRLAAFGVIVPSQDQQRRMAFADVSLSFVRTLRTAGYAVRSPATLLRLAEHGVNENYVSTLAADGYRLDSPDDLIALVDHGVSVGFVASLQKLGYRPSAPDLVRLVDHGVSTGFVVELVSMGYRPSLGEFVDLVDHGVSLRFVASLRKLGYRPSEPDLVRLADHGVSTAFVTEFVAMGYRPSLEQLVDLVDHGVTVAFVRKVTANGDKPDIERLLRLRDEGM